MIKIIGNIKMLDKASGEIAFQAIALTLCIAILDFSLTFIIGSVVAQIMGQETFIARQIKFIIGGDNINLVLILLVVAYLAARVKIIEKMNNVLFRKVYSIFTSMSDDYVQRIGSSYNLCKLFSYNGMIQKIFSEDIGAFVNGIIVPIIGIAVELIVIVLLVIYMVATVGVSESVIPMLFAIPILIIFLKKDRRKMLLLGLSREGISKARQEFLAKLDSAIVDVNIFNGVQHIRRKLSYINTEFANISAAHTAKLQNNRVIFETLIMAGLIGYLMIASLKGLGEIKDVQSKIGIIFVVSMRLLPSFSRILQLSQGVGFLMPAIAKLANDEAMIKSGRASHVAMKFKDFKVINDEYIFKSLVILRDNKNLLNGEEFKFSTGDFITVAGKSGAGKSTLVEAVYSQLQESGHSVVLLRQFPGIIDNNIIDNITLGVTDIDKLKLCMNVAGIGLSIDDCYDQSIKSDSLSGGQIQRMNLARALYFNAQIILLDEFTSSLDAETEIEILERLKSLCEKGKAIICVSHRLAAEKYSNKKYIIKNRNLKLCK